MEITLKKDILDSSIATGLLSDFKINPWGMLDHLDKTLNAKGKTNSEPLYINHGGLSNLKATKEHKQAYRQIHPYIIANHADVSEKAVFKLYLHRDGNGALKEAVIKTK